LLNAHFVGIVGDTPKNSDILKFYNKLNELKQSDSDILLQRSSAIITLIGFAMPVLQQVLASVPKVL
jgi:hypothetical protein